MNVLLNGEAFALQGRTLADLIAEAAPPTPFAAAVNTVFVPKPAYADTVLEENDHIDIVRPVVGG